MIRGLGRPSVCRSLTQKRTARFSVPLRELRGHTDRQPRGAPNGAPAPRVLMADPRFCGMPTQGSLGRQVHLLQRRLRRKRRSLLHVLLRSGVLVRLPPSAGITPSSMRTVAESNWDRQLPQVRRQRLPYGPKVQPPGDEQPWAGTRLRGCLRLPTILFDLQLLPTARCRLLPLRQRLLGGLLGQTP